jgi:hypothetical protein
VAGPVQSLRPDVDAGLALITRYAGVVRYEGGGGGNTPTGTSVPVTIGAVSLTFATVTQPGQTTITPLTTLPTPANGFQFGTPAASIDISTTAAFAGAITVCIDYGGITFTNPGTLRLFHYESGGPVDVTIPNPAGAVPNVICGSVTSLSPFAVLEAIPDTTPPAIAALGVNPGRLWPPNHQMVAVTVSVSVTDDRDANPACGIVAVGSNEAERSGNGTGRVYTLTVRCTDAAGNSTIRTVAVTVPHDQGKK